MRCSRTFGWRILGATVVRVKAERPSDGLIACFGASPRGRRMVDQTGPSWNRIAGWLKAVEGVREAA